MSTGTQTREPLLDVCSDQEFTQSEAVTSRLAEPRLNLVYRLEASVGDLQDVCGISTGHRRIVPLTSGTFSGPELRRTLLPGASADWQIILPDGTALGDVRYTLEAERGDVLYVQSQSVRHGSTAVLERLGRGGDVDAGECTFRTSVKIETGADSLDWLNKGLVVGVGGRQRGGVIYEVYLVG